MNRVFIYEVVVCIRFLQADLNNREFRLQNINTFFTWRRPRRRRRRYS